jgi:hypothetical protein
MYKYSKEIKKFIGKHVYYDTYGGGYIWGKLHKDQEVQMIAQVEDVDEKTDKDNPIISVRGWGAIQHLFKTYDESKEFQDELGKFICDAVNEKLKTL